MRIIFVISCLCLVWSGLASAAMLTGQIKTAAIPATQIALPAEISIVGARNGFLILRSDDPDYVQKLYAAGARIVLPARQKTCLSFQG